MNKKIKITKELCRKVQIMVAGGGTMAEIGGLLGVSKATVSRIKAAEYDPERYEQLNRARMEKEKAKTEPAEEDEKTEECPGQISMDELKEIEPKKEQRATDEDLNKLIRFLAGQFGKMAEELESLKKAMGDMMERQEMTVFHKLDKINNNLGQLVRLTGPEKVEK